MQPDHDAAEALASLCDEGWIESIHDPIKSGKEATVYACRGGVLAGGRPVAAKIYQPLETRRFKNDAIYLAGRMQFARETRMTRALRNGTAAGKRIAAVLWLEQEWQVLGTLHAAGADVPAPLARNNRAIVMEMIGDERGPAPRLHDAAVGPDEAESLLARLLDAVEAMLDCHVVHGDLSPYNVLLWRGRPVVIDFPQAVDPRLNPAALTLLARDVEQLCHWARRRGIDADAAEIASDLWGRFTAGELG